jgi:predicted nucleic-acid-binding protein
MTGLDTTVLVRFIMQDDPSQSPKASALMRSLSAEAPGFITLVSVVELAWVLGACYELGRAEISEALEGLLHTKELVVDQAQIVWKAVRNYRRSKADLADALIAAAATAAGCDRTVTFDRGAAKHSGMKLLES